MNEKLLEKHGWTVECESPLEIRHEETGSFATLLAAEMVIEAIEKEDREDRYRIRGIEYSEELDNDGYCADAKDQFGVSMTIRRLFREGDKVICKYPDEPYDGIEIELDECYTVDYINAYHGQPQVYLKGFPRVRFAEWRFTHERI